MADIKYFDIPGAMQRGWEFGTQQRLQREGEERQRGLASLASQAYTAPQEQRASILSQMAGLDRQAAAQQESQFQSGDERRNQMMANMARILVAAPTETRAGLYRQMYPTLKGFGMSDLPTDYTPESAPIIDKAANAIAKAAMGAQGVPTGFRELDMTAQAAGYQPGTPEYQQAAQVALGMRGRAATGGFGFKEIVGLDGRTRWTRTNPRTGAMEVYDETTGDFAPLGAAGQLNPGSGAPNLGAPITMPADLNQAFAGLAESFPGTKITSTMRTPQRNAQVGGVPNSQHLRGTAADFVVPAQHKPAFMQAARQNGFEAIDEGDHIHLEQPPGARTPVGRPGLGVSRSPEEQAALTTAAQEQAKINAEMAAYRKMTGLEAERASAVEGAKATAKAGADRADAQRTKSDALRVYEAGLAGLQPAMAGTITGPLAGRVPAVTTGQQTAEGAIAAMAPILKQIFRTAGEGTFTDSDQKLLMDMIPKRTDTPEARTAKLANIDAIVRAKLGGASQPQAASAASGGGNVDDLLGKYGIR